MDPSTVRLWAAGAKETAWEEDHDGLIMGAFTKALCDALNHAADTPEDRPVVSWWTTMIRVNQVVNATNPWQHPQVEGPHDRLPFTLLSKRSDGLPFRVVDNVGIVEAGRVAGVEVGNEFGVMPPGSMSYDKDTSLGQVKVTNVQAFRSQTTYRRGKLYPDGSIAFLLSEMPHRWVALVPDHLLGVRKAIGDSNFLRLSDTNDEEKWVVKITEEAGRVCAYNQSNVLVASERLRTSGAEDHVGRQFIKTIEQLARAHHLLRLAPGQGDENFDHGLSIEVSKISDPRGIMSADATGTVNAGQSAKFTLCNQGHKIVWVSIFDVNTKGQIQFLKGWQNIEILPDRDWEYGQDGNLRLDWPTSVEGTDSIEETLVFIISDTEVDLRVFASHLSGERDTRSTLGYFAHHLACGALRDFVDTRAAPAVRFDVFQLRFTLLRT
ncbi:hypothetical protein EKO04_008960 [Ascochyta lentis]|uniref:Uncharacterized protein n=1 Tax=Ascochyta lentis TaxID=205686 RepID=A0A8H7IXP2_9PLEO|nr:hypothetical protein EKO04_008960 [Ascochyta lentis]